MYTCSNEPTWSSRPFARYFTGRIILDRLANRYKPGYWPPFEMGTYPISRSSGTPCFPSVFHIRRLDASCAHTAAGAQPMRRPSSCTHRLRRPSTEGANACVMPCVVSNAGRCATASGAVTIRHVRERWLRRPHGEPSGVCTGQRKPKNMVINSHKGIKWASYLPHASGRSFRTVVVLSSAKKAPRCIERKWLI